MFRFFDATTADERMAELERFIEWWYGPRKPEYGTPLDELYDLPAPLRRFYAFAGRWPSPDPVDSEECYNTGGLHYLLPPDKAAGVSGRKLYFFDGYQGSWHGLTEHSGDNPPVWLKGFLPFLETPDDKPGTFRVLAPLSAFLVSHVLNVTVTRNGRYSKGRAETVGTPIWSHTDEEYPGDTVEFVASGDRLVRQAQSTYTTARRIG